MNLFKWVKKLTTTEMYEPRGKLLNGTLRASQYVVTAGLGYELHHVGLAGPAAIVLGVLFFTAKVVGKTGWMLERDRGRAYARTLATV